MQFKIKLCSKICELSRLMVIGFGFGESAKWQHNLTVTFTKAWENVHKRDIGNCVEKGNMQLEDVSKVMKNLIVWRPKVCPTF